MTAARILLALLCLLTFVTSASAECAWVLWASPVDSIDSAYPSLAACDKALEDTRQTLKAQGYTVVDRIAPGYHIVSGRKETERLIYRCLPDTVDPRGPKGK